MNRKIASAILLTLLLASMLTLAFNIQRVKPEAVQDQPTYEAYLGDWTGNITYQKKYDYDRYQPTIFGSPETIFGWHMTVEIESSLNLTIQLGRPETPDKPMGIGRGNFTITVKESGFIRDFYRIYYSPNLYYEYTLLDYGPPHIKVASGEEGDETLSFSTNDVRLYIDPWWHPSEGTVAVLFVIGWAAENYYVVTMPITYQIDRYWKNWFGWVHSTEVVEDIIYFPPSHGIKYFEVDVPSRNIITLAYEHESTAMPYYEGAIGKLHGIIHVCIDPGHIPTKNPLEYAINKRVADKVKSKLEAKGIAVNLTNPSDDWPARASYTNALKPAIFVSLHCNAWEGFEDGIPIGTVRGSEVWICDDTDSSEQATNEHDLAVQIVNNLVAGIRSRLREGDYAIWKEKTSRWPNGIPILRSVTVCPAVLLEMEFYDYSKPVTYKDVTYPNMLELMNTATWQEDAAHGIANGILGYLEERGLTITGHSPVDIVVTDPDGLTISKHVNEILGATYTEIDLDGDGDLDDQIRIPDRKIGDYTIMVLPEPGVLPTDTFTLEVSLFGIPIIIVENVQISDIPSQPYIVTSTETEIIPVIQIVQAIVNFNPDTLNLKSKGKVTTVYIELPAGYDLSQIDVSSIRLNGTVPALAKPTEIGDYDGDGVPDLMVKFNRQDLIAILSEGEATLTMTGEVNGIPFEGSDTVRVNNPH